jgi:hypothetical protein
MTTIDQRSNILALDTALPTPIYNNVWGPARGTKYGEQYTMPMGKWRSARAREGSYFVAHNATNDAATTLAGHAAPVLADADATMTKPFIFLRNPSATTSIVKVELDYIEITVVTAGAAGTTASWAAQIDYGNTRWSSGGTALTIVNPNAESSATSVFSAASNSCLGGAVVAGSENSTSRDLGFGDLKPTIEVAGDKKLFIFGEDPTDVAATAAAAVRTQIQVMPPVILGPTGQFLLALYAPSQSGAGIYKVRMGWSER